MHKSRDSFPPRHATPRARKPAYLLTALALALGLGLLTSWFSQQSMPQAPPQAPPQAVSPGPLPSLGVSDLFRH